jgi:hypothetical protein
MFNTHREIQMKTIRVIVMLGVILLVMGCSKDDNGPSSANSTHTVKYVVTATNADVFVIAYTNEGNGTTTVTPTTGSWQWQNTFNGGMTVALAAGGTSMSGATVTVHATIYKDGAVLKDVQASSTGTCNVSTAAQI